MAKYQRIVTTEAGLQLLEAAYTGGTVEFTALKTGAGVYTGAEDLAAATALKSVRQSFGISGVFKEGTQIKVRAVITNTGLTTGYGITEIGLFAKDKSGKEILYAVILAEVEDYLPPYSVAPTTITMEIYLDITAAESATFVATEVPGTYVTVEDFNDYVNSIVPITTAEIDSVVG